MEEMKYSETQDYSFLLDRYYFVYDHQEDENSLHIYIKSKVHKCKCPKCGAESAKTPLKKSSPRLSSATRIIFNVRAM